MRLSKKQIFIAMANNGINTSQLQKITGIAPATLRYAINGISNARPETAEKIARALNMELSEIVEEG